MARSRLGAWLSRRSRPPVRDLAQDLALTYAFPPTLGTSALVAARRLRERGLVTDVVSHAMGDQYRPDPGSVRVAAEVLGEHVVLDGPSSSDTWAGCVEYADRALAAVAGLEARPGAASYRSVYSRSMPVASHVAAALLKARRPEIRWTAEFSDPLRASNTGEPRLAEIDDDAVSRELRASVAAAGFPQPENSRLLFAWGEVLAYALADEVIFTNVNQRDLMLAECPDRALAGRAGRVGSVSAHPTLPPAYYAMERSDVVLDPGVVNIGYFGAFYASRGLGVVEDALLALTFEERSRLRLTIFTRRFRQRRDEAAAKGLAGVVQARPFVDFLPYLELTTRFDVLLVNDAETAGRHALNPYLPSKVSDYLGSGSAIWSITEPGSVLSTLETAYTSSIGDVEGAVAVLRAALADNQR